MSLNYVYNVERRHFGRQPMFCETKPVLCDTIAPLPELQKQYMLRNPVHRHVQNTPRYSEADTNTLRAEYCQSGVNHAEGGWPRDVNVQDQEATQRYRRRIEKEDGYINCVMALSPVAEHLILQNNANDLYKIYYTDLPEFPQTQQSDCRTVNILRDEPAQGPARPVSSVNWQPEGGQRLAVAYLDVDFDRTPLASCDSYVWNVEQTACPEVTLTPPSPVLDLRFKPRNVNVLVGGLMNGQVCAWDQRAGSAPVTRCPPHVAHRDLVHNVLFTSAKSGMEFFSGGADGTIKWWDQRHMDDPVDEVILDMVDSVNEKQSMARATGVSVLEFEPTIPTRFMAGTENGLVIMGNRKGKTSQEKLPGKFHTHVGPVRALERNPGFLKNFLTVGDWSACVWSEECRESAILWSSSLRNKVTHGTWSPTRMSLMLLTYGNGVLALWDLLRRQHEPVLTLQVCKEPLQCVRVHEDGRLLACGGSNSNVYLQELSPSLRESDTNDKVLLGQVFERETKCERILEGRMREIRLKQRQRDEGSPDAASADSDAALGDRDLADAAAEYMAAIKKEQHTFI